MYEVDTPAEKHYVGVVVVTTLTSRTCASVQSADVSDGIDSVARRGASSNAAERAPRELHAATELRCTTYPGDGDDVSKKKLFLFVCLLLLFFFTQRNDHFDRKTRNRLRHKILKHRTRHRMPKVS